MPSLTGKLHYRVNTQRPVQYPKIEHMNYVSHRKGGPGVITTTQLFQFWVKKLAHQNFTRLIKN